MISRKKLRTTLVRITLALAATSALYAGCGDKGSESTGREEGGLPINPAGLSNAKGWTQLSVDANSAKNSVDASGHFHTDKNICQQAGDGVLELKNWNALSEDLNRVAISAPLPTPRCWDSPSNSKFYNKGLAELINTNYAADTVHLLARMPAMASSPSPVPSGSPNTQPTPHPSAHPQPVPSSPSQIESRRTLFEYKDGQICTTIADQALAESIMSQIEILLLNADRAGSEDCPGYLPPHA